MDTSEFLRTVWPDTGLYLTAIPNRYTDANGVEKFGYRHFAHTSIDEAVAKANALAFDRFQPTDVYFALATVKEDLTRMKKVEREALGKKVRGRHKRSGYDNTQAVKCFWLDIDVKPDPDAYPTRNEAAAALKQFCQAMGLPKPLVTSSGGGFHVYWPLSEPLDGDKWAHYAGILKRLTKSWGLRADASRTSDRASVLRPVGTLNFKDRANPRPVQVVMVGAVNDTTDFLRRLATLAERADLADEPSSSVVNIQVSSVLNLGERPDLPGAAAALNAAAGTGIGSNADNYTEANPRLVVAKCPQLRWQATHAGEVSEPQWYDMVGCLRHAERGAEAVHLLSKGHPDYDQATTEQKILQHIEGDFGPTLCATFESHRPGGCATCLHRGKVKTPLVLGRQLKAVEAPKITLQASGAEAVQITLPNPPAPFKRATNSKTGQARITMLMSDDEGDYEEEIYEYDIYPSQLIQDERSNSYRVTLSRWLPHDGWGEFQISAGALYDRRKLTATLGDVGVLPDPSKIEYLVQYMIGYIRELQKLNAATRLYAQLGWRGETKFVLLDQLVTPAGVEPLQPSSNIELAFHLSKYPPRMGDLETWKDIVSIFERPQMIAHQFAFGVGFATPLLTLTQYHGMIVSLVGEPGAGKSSALYCANSIWGHRWLGGVDGKQDTIKGFYAKIGALQHLPVTYDEITNLDPRDLSDLAYSITKGQGRQALNQDGTMRQGYGDWSTILLTTANASIHERLALAKADASAEAVRVFEYRVPEHTLTKDEADANFDRLLEHYGHAGPIYATALIQRRAWAQDRIKHWTHAIDQRAKVTSGERYWSACVACVLTGFELANDCGLTNADIERLAAFGVGVIQTMRGTVSSNTKDPLSMLGEYVNRSMRSILALNNDPTKGAPMFAMEPTAELRIRVEHWAQRMYVDRADFRRFCSSQGVDPGTVQRELKRLGVLKADAVRLVLGRGTKYGLAQSYAWLIDLSNPAMGHMAVTTANPAAVVATSQS